MRERGGREERHTHVAGTREGGGRKEERKEERERPHSRYSLIKEDIALSIDDSVGRYGADTSVVEFKPRVVRTVLCKSNIMST